MIKRLGPAAFVKPDIGYVVRHSGHCLHTLILGYDTTLSVDMDLELELLPYLHTLEAPTAVFSDEVIQKITQYILLPNIRSLTLAINRIASLEYLIKLIETKSLHSPTVPRLLLLTVVIFQQYEDIRPNMLYIEARKKRIEACGTKFDFCFKDNSMDVVI
ncbi:hypothetical protein C0992_007723 [Termitomyces sp. T32_za158]|nr:hypothetical protein C0992_007723 [Termitomyces sp. T32_za158]